jgi:hypothetical protein
VLFGLFDEAFGKWQVSGLDLFVFHRANTHALSICIACSFLAFVGNKKIAVTFSTCHSKAHTHMKVLVLPTISTNSCRFDSTLSTRKNETLDVNFWYPWYPYPKNIDIRVKFLFIGNRMIHLTDHSIEASMGVFRILDFNRICSSI